MRSPTHPTTTIHWLIDDGLPEVPLLGVSDLGPDSPGTIEHHHPGLIEVTCLHGGDLQWTLEGEKVSQWSGELLAVHPGESHATAGQGKLYWLQILPPREGHGFLGLPAVQAAAIASDLWQLPRRAAAGREPWATRFEEIIDLHHGGRGTGRPIAERLLDLVLAMLSHARTPPRYPRDPALQRVTERIRSEPERPYDAARLAGEAGLSLSGFQHRFAAQVGQSPARFALAMRVARARELLVTTDQSVLEIALRLGFSSSQYFSTVFRRITGRAPSDVRAQERPPTGRRLGGLA